MALVPSLRALYGALYKESLEVVEYSQATATKVRTLDLIGSSKDKETYTRPIDNVVEAVVDDPSSPPNGDACDVDPDQLESGLFANQEGFSDEDE